MHERKHGKRESREQAIAIGLSKARRAGEDVPPPKERQNLCLNEKESRERLQGRTQKTGHEEGHQEDFCHEESGPEKRALPERNKRRR